MDEGSLIRIVLSLFFVVLLILGAAWISKRQGWLKTGDTQRLRIISSQRLGARASLVLIRIDDTEVLLGVTPQAINALHTQTALASFSQQLDQAQAKQP